MARAWRAVSDWSLYGRKLGVEVGGDMLGAADVAAGRAGAAGAGCGRRLPGAGRELLVEAGGGLLTGGAAGRDDWVGGVDDRPAALRLDEPPLARARAAAASAGLVLGRTGCELLLVAALEPDPADPADPTDAAGDEPGRAAG